MEGFVYEISEEQRKTLSSPRCEVFREREKVLRFLQEHRIDFVTCVGDVVTEKFSGVWNKAIIDNMCAREPYVRSIEIKPEILLYSKNPRGKITRDAWEKVKLLFCFNKKTLLEVEGEEDLLALPAIYFSPLNSAVLFGLLGRGIGVIKASLEYKGRIKNYVKHLENHEIALVGGTFERFHAGHKYLLLTALEHAKNVIVGVTSDKYTACFKPTCKESFYERAKRVKEFLKKHTGENRVKVIELHDAYGITLDVENACLVVSEETLERAKEINEERVKMGENELEIVCVPIVYAKDGEPISSERIKKGEIDEDGFLLKR